MPLNTLTRLSFLGITYGSDRALALISHSHQLALPPYWSYLFALNSPLRYRILKILEHSLNSINLAPFSRQTLRNLFLSRT